MEMNRNGMNRKTKQSWEELPGEIIELILSKLLFFNLPTCRLICKSWNELVLTCKFDAPKPSINSNLLFAQFCSSPNNLCCVELDVDDDKNKQVICIVASFTRLFQIINSCNGLLCCSSRLLESIFILNPMTNECLELPSQHSNLKYGYGFGFSPKTKQYKTVRHSLVSHETDQVLVEILALGTTAGAGGRQWTRATLVPFNLSGHGTYFNGALYWIGSHPHPHPSALVIFRFDLDDEKFEETSYTASPPRDFSGVLGVFQDTLYLTTIRGQVWKLEQDSSSWINVFGAPLLLEPDYCSGYLQIIKVYEDGKILFALQIIKVYEDGKILFAYGSNIILYDPTPTIGTSQILKTKLGMKKHFFAYQFDSFTFDSLDKILASQD